MTAGRNIPIARPSFGEEEWQALRQPLESGWVTQGPRVAEFERSFGSLHGVEHALATTSCTTALHLGLAALGIGPGDEVIVPSFTWVASANVVRHLGARPVLVDVSRETYNVDVRSVSAALTTRTRAVMVVHLFGRCADVDAVRDVLPEGVAIVEDAACAAGARYAGRIAGSLGDVAGFSFHPRKVITTGEGGMLTVREPHVARRAERLRNHGASVPEEVRHHGSAPWRLPDFEEVGFNYRMTDLQAAVGIVQLSKLDRFLVERHAIAQRYRQELSDLEWLRQPAVPPGWRHGWQAYVCYVDPRTAPAPRDVIMEELAASGVQTRPGTHAVHLLGAYRDLGYAPDDLPASRDCADNTMAIPLHNMLTSEDVDHVIRTLHEVC